MIMKKLVFLTLLTLTAINLSAAEKTNEKAVITTIGSYVYHNPIKCLIVGVLATDYIINGYNGSIAKMTVNFAKKAGNQLLQDGKVVQGATLDAIDTIKMKFS